MKNQRSILVFSAIFAALVAVALFQQRQENTVSRQETPLPTSAIQLARLFDGLSGDDIAAVRLQIPDSETNLTIQRAENGQWVTPGLDGTIDPGTAEAIVRTIQLLPYARTLDIDANTDFADYGFEPRASLLIQVILRNGGTHGVVVGGLTPSTLNYYAVVDEQEEIYLIESGPIKFLLDLTESTPTA